MLTESQITKFQQLYKSNFGKKISHKEALEKGMRLVNLVKLVLKPVTEQELKQLTKDSKT